MNFITEGDFYRKDELVITKQEELEALQALRNIFIPKFVEKWNKAKHWDSVHITVEDVSKKLKKEKHYMFGDKDAPHGGHFSDYIVYTSTVGNRKFLFYIDKMYDQRTGIPTDKREMVLGAGFQDPFVLQDWSYQVGENYL